VLLPSIGHAADAPKKRVLFFTKSSGFEHSVISWKTGKPSHAEKVLLELGAKNGWEFTFSKDGSLFSPEYLAQFDALFFYTTGNLCERGTDGEPPMTEAGKQALLDAVKNGKGFVGSHSATDTFHTNNESKKGQDRYVDHGASADPYVKMIGGEFIKHGAQQKSRMRNVDPAFPGLTKVGDGFDLHEEWYSLKEFADDMHVLLVQETGTMKGLEYARGPYPATWTRMHGKGRVFYTSMGHREDVWTNPLFQEILTGGLTWSMGGEPAKISPNLLQAAPRARELPPFPPPKEKAPAAPATAPKP
jgi:type 1 glutamine amidotransferase